jgi:acetoacetyl-CoA synthetase
MHGRSDGVLNIGGIRIGPAEIYRILRGIPGIADGMAVEQREPGGSRLVLLIVLQSGHCYDDELEATIRSTLRREGGPAHVPQVIAPVAALPLTHNGKRSESAARDALNGDPVRNLQALSNPGSLDDVVASVRKVLSDAEPTEDSPGEDPLVDAVRRAFADVLGRRSVPRHANFFDLGGTSRQCMTLLRRLRLDLRRPVTLDAFLADPSVEGLAEALQRPAGESSRFSVLREGHDEGRPTLYLVHGVYGDVDAYRSTLEHLVTDMRVVGIEAALTHDDGSPKTVPELAAEHVEALQSFQPTGRLCLVGYSFGGLVAFEMARQLAAAGRTPDQLVLLDVRPPKAGLTPAQRQIRKVSSALILLLPFLGAHSLRTALVDRVRGRGPGAERDVVRGGFRLFHDYRWGPYDGAVAYCRARVRVPVVMNQIHAWRTVAPRLTVVDVPGRHEDLLSARNAPELAARITEVLGTVP